MLIGYIYVTPPRAGHFLSIYGVVLFIRIYSKGLLKETWNIRPSAHVFKVTRAICTNYTATLRVEPRSPAWKLGCLYLLLDKIWHFNVFVIRIRNKFVHAKFRPVFLLRQGSKCGYWVEFHMNKSRSKEENLLHVVSPSVFTCSVTVHLIQCYSLLKCKYCF